MRKNLVKFTAFIGIIFLIFLYSLVENPSNASNPNNVSIYLNGQYIHFPDQKPFIDSSSNRTLVPVRFFAEAIDNTSVKWNDETRTVTINSNNREIRLNIGSATVYINGIAQQIEAIPQIINNRTMVPLRFISELFDTEVRWDASTYSVYLTRNNTSENFMHSKNITGQISMGDSESHVIDVLGSPARMDLSEYGFYWYIYNQDYSRYIQVGIMNQKVVALYTNSKYWNIIQESKIVMNRDGIRAYYGKPLEYIIKGRTKYTLNTNNQRDVFLVGNYYITFFYDIHKNNEVSSIKIVDKSIEDSLHRYGTPSEELRISYEKQLFDLANATRARHGKPLFQWNDNAASVALKHSNDMLNRNYFAHDTPDGKTIGDRFLDNGIRYRAVAENLAAGQQSPIYAHEGLMNSLGHRENLLGNYRYLGTGVAFGGSYNTYYTQNFYTPR